jgi:type IV pilus assembly protein PilE
MNKQEPRLRPSAAGFTLIELMIAVAIIAVIAAIAFPSYQSSVRKGRRAEAFAALAAIQQAQERWRSSHAQYGNTSDFAATMLTSSNSLYALTITSGSSESQYEVTATAQGAQSSETVCKLLAVKIVGGNAFYGSGESAVDYADPGRCWAK